MDSKSPESETTVVYCLSESSAVDIFGNGEEGGGGGCVCVCGMSCEWEAEEGGRDEEGEGARQDG